VRISHDVDLLVNLEDIGLALKYPEEEGFVLMHDNVWPQNKIQQELLTNATHHITLWNKKLNMYLELHWAERLIAQTNFLLKAYFNDQHQLPDP